MKDYPATISPPARTIAPPHPSSRRDRSRPIAILGAVLLLLGSPACSVYSGMSDELEARIRSEATLSPSIDEDEAVMKIGAEVAERHSSPSEAFELPDSASLELYIEKALERNPSIQERIRAIEALGMRVSQVTSLNDPMLSAVPPTGRMLQTAGGEVDGAIGLSQGIPFPSKLSAMGRVAEQVVRIALENLRSERLRIVAEVKKAYYAYYLANVSIDITRENDSLLTQIRDVADARYRSGEAVQQDVLRAEVELYNLSNELITLEQQRLTAMARLNVLMDREVRAPLPSPPVFDPRKMEARFEALLAKAVEANPDLKAIQEQVRRDMERIGLARLQYYPDLNIGALLTFIGGGISPVANGQNVWNLSLGLTLPIWFQRLRAGVLQRNAELLASALQYRNTRNELFFEIQDLTVRVDAAYRSSILLRDAILPKARQTVEVSASSYQAGHLEFLSWIDNWRQLLQLTLEYHHQLSTLEGDLAELERVVGGVSPGAKP